ncbi:cob(I)yrinic acid a,c-diamide adenosyltransferase [Spirochaetota bacterium]
MKMMEKGYIQIYTGNGKGKTTAAMGLALRASGAGLKTIIIQFMKGQYYSELDAVKLLKDYIKIEQFGSRSFRKPGDKDSREHHELAKKGYARAMEVLKGNDYSIIILDEIITSLKSGLITLEEIFKLIEIKPENIELILTGRGAPEELIKKADLVTEMKEIKHYYNEGVDARVGIEK